ncbi:MAG: hypothetical protein LBB24_00200 [Rickettsiales bacterium]|jgi:hypothetical protein|nr:hypothetical protein [Rickettsiales bacterium]
MGQGRQEIEQREECEPSIFENSRHAKSSSIILEYIFFAILMAVALYSVITSKDIPANTATLLRWMGVVVTFGVEGYKINERICDIRSDKLKLTGEG